MAVEGRDLLYIVLSRLEGSLLAGDALSRRALQDIVCIAQAWGLPLGYEFTFSLKGPQSNGLLPDIMELQSRTGTYARRARGLRVGRDLSRALDSLGAFVGPLREDRRRLHLVSSVMFLGGQMGLTRRKIVEHFRRYAPEYFPFEIAEVIELVNERTPLRIA